MQFPQHLLRYMPLAAIAGIGVGAADKACLVQSGGKVDATIQHGVVEAVEQCAVGFHHLCVVAGQLRQEEKAKHPALAVAAKRQACLVCSSLQTR